MLSFNVWQQQVVPTIPAAFTLGTCNPVSDMSCVHLRNLTPQLLAAARAAFLCSLASLESSVLNTVFGPRFGTLGPEDSSWKLGPTVSPPWFLPGLVVLQSPFFTVCASCSHFPALAALELISCSSGPAPSAAWLVTAHLPQMLLLLLPLPGCCF